ncbi:MAG: class I SAM-dependent methyltransferase [Myxococcaceae bacterium]
MLLVTTTGKLGRRGELAQAQALASRLSVPFVPYEPTVVVEQLLQRAAAVLRVRGDGVELIDAQGATRWTPGMADLRIRRLEQGVDQPDGILVAGEIREGDRVLDCTLGLAQDAWVLAHAVGKRGRVVGLEKSLPLYALSSEGLRTQDAVSSRALIECIHTDAFTYLTSQPTGTFDVVYFDPMFSKSALAQSGFSLLRRHAAHAPPPPELLKEAARVARRWVVVKAAPNTGDLHRLGLSPLPFRRHADLRFGRLAGVEATSHQAAADTDQKTRPAQAPPAAEKRA